MSGCIGIIMGVTMMDLSPIISVMPGRVGYPASHRQTDLAALISRLEGARDGPILPHGAEHRQFSREVGDWAGRRRSKNIGVMDHPRALKELVQAPFIILLTGRVSTLLATAGSKAARVPASSLLQVTGAEEYLMVAVLELPAAARQAEDSMAEGGDKSSSAAHY